MIAKLKTKLQCNWARRTIDDNLLSIFFAGHSAGASNSGGHTGFLVKFPNNSLPAK